MIETMRSNFGRRFERVCKPSARGCRWLWKHSVGAEGIIHVLESTIGKDLSNTSIIAMIRSPIALLVAWKEDPWDMIDCVDRPFERMNKPCQAAIAAESGYKHAGLANAKAPKLSFNSTISVYNHYLHTYVVLQRAQRFKSVSVVRYEDVVFAPHAIVRNVASKLGWPQPETPVIVEGSAKGHRSHDRDQAIALVASRSYLNGISGKMLHRMCGRLNIYNLLRIETFDVSKDVMASGYDAGHDYYLNDCRNETIANRSSEGILSPAEIGG